MTERVLNALEAQERKKKQERALTAWRAKQEQVGQKLGEQRWAQYLRKVRRKRQEKAEQDQLEREAIAAMSPAEYDAFKRRVPVSGPHPLPPAGFVMVLQDIATEDAKARNQALEAAEQRAGIPKLQAASAARCQELRDATAAAVTELDERRRELLATGRREVTDEEDRLRAEVQAMRESLEAVKA